MAIDQNARLGLPTEKTSCTSKPYTTTDFPLGTGGPGWASTYQVITRLNTTSPHSARPMRHPRPPPTRRARPADREPRRGGRRAEAQREAGQGNEHDDREPPVDQPGRPEWSGIGGVARPGALENVVEHDEQGGQAPDPVQADDAARPGGRNRRGGRG